MEMMPPLVNIESPCSGPRDCPSLLLQLPLEIRSTILELHFTNLDFQLLSKRTTNASRKSSPLQCRSNQPAFNPLSLLGVSRQIRHEALPHLGKSNFTVTALFPGWHQANRDTLGISSVHATRIQCLELRFLDSNFSILQALPNLRKVFINPPGELRCRRRSNDDLRASSCWSREEIDGGQAWDEMTTELADSMKLMHKLVDASPSHMEFEVHFSVGFKFLIKPLHWSDSGRLLSTRGNFYSVVCKASTSGPSISLRTALRCHWSFRQQAGDSGRHNRDSVGQANARLNTSPARFQLCTAVFLGSIRTPER